MLKNHCLAKSISSVAWGEFFRQLEYKSDFYGREFNLELEGLNRAVNYANAEQLTMI